MEKGPSQLGLPVVFAPSSHAGFDLWYSSLKVGDWSHRALHHGPTTDLDLRHRWALICHSARICQYPGCWYGSCAYRQGSFFIPIHWLLNNLSLLIFPDKLFPLLLTFPVTARPEFILFLFAFALTLCVMRRWCFQLLEEMLLYYSSQLYRMQMAPKLKFFFHHVKHTG